MHCTNKLILIDLTALIEIDKVVESLDDGITELILLLELFFIEKHVFLVSLRHYRELLFDIIELPVIEPLVKVTRTFPQDYVAH